MKYKKVLVVLGGLSGEREVSLDSGRACVKALKKKGYKVSIFDPKKKPLNLIDKTKVAGKTVKKVRTALLKVISNI